MVSFRSLFAAIPLVSLALAQVQTVKIAFTSVPAAVIAGQSYNITWGGGDGSSVTITLRQGTDTNNLDVVGTLTDDATGYWWVWNVSEALPSATDYALQIIQGLTGINYSGMFALVGGTGGSNISYSGYTTTTSGASTVTITNNTITTSLTAANATTTGSSNGTISTASLTTGTGGVTFGATSSTRSATTATATHSANSGVSQTGSSAALIMGIVAAVMCLH